MCCNVRIKTGMVKILMKMATVMMKRISQMKMILIIIRNLRVDFEVLNPVAAVLNLLGNVNRFLRQLDKEEVKPQLMKTSTLPRILTVTVMRISKM